GPRRRPLRRRHRARDAGRPRADPEGRVHRLHREADRGRPPRRPDRELPPAAPRRRGGAAMSSVFVVDDTLADRELVSLVLEASGYETVAFESSRKALEAVEQDAPDLVVLDLLMPELDGLDVVQELRAHASTRQQRILILTAHYKPEELAGLGLDPRCLVLAKPVLPHQLLAAVDAALDPGLPAVESLPAQLAARCARLRAGKPIVRELERREAELERAQRLDALGRLAPGIAHDFNNLLQVIGGYGAALRDRLGAAEAEEICKASARAAELTRQLLSFARRETAERRVLDANEVVADVATMLDRVIGEHVRLRIEADERGCGVLGDRAELEQVLVNLAVNARDAMARGGDLVVATSAGAGEVRLSVGDTGTGMNRDTLARAFEPFFTTKGPGRGTGLGLAIVARVAEQWGGRVEVVSAPGEGTTVTLVLPQVAVRPAPAEAPPERRSQ